MLRPARRCVKLLTAAAPPRDLAGRGRDRDRLAVRLLAAVRLRRHLHVRGRHAERRAACGGAVARPRPAARAARPGGAARPDRPGRARRRSRPTCSASPTIAASPRRDQLHDVLRARRRSDASSRLQARVVDGRRRVEPMLEALRGERRAVKRAARRRGALDRRRRRRACTATRSARCRRAACRPRSWRTCPTRCRGWSGGTRRRTVRSRPTELRERYGVDCGAVLTALERDGDLVQGELRPGGSEREWCDPEVLRRLRRASLAVLRKEVEPVEAERARALPARPGRASTATRRAAPGSIACARCWCRSRAWRCRPRCGSATCCRGAPGAYSPAWMDQLCASGELVWIGAGRARAHRGAWRCTSARTWRCSVRRRRVAGGATLRVAPAARCAARAARAPAPASSPTCSSTSTLAPEELQEALWDLVWAGEVTNDAFAPLRAPRLTLARAQRGAQRAARPHGTVRGAPARRGAAAQVQGRWSLTAPLLARRRRSGGAPAGAGRAAARALRRPDARAGAGRGRPGRLLGDLPGADRSSRCSGSRGAATSSRASAARSSRCRARSSGCASVTAAPTQAPVVLAAVDPAQPYGAALRVAASATSQAPGARSPGA